MVRLSSFCRGLRGGVLALLLLGGSGQASALNSVQDPHRLLGLVSDFLADSVAAESSCRQRASYIELANQCEFHCGSGACIGGCWGDSERTYSQSFSECQGQKRVLKTSLGRQWVLNQTDFRGSRWVSEFLSQIDDYVGYRGYARLDRLEYGHFDIDQDASVEGKGLPVVQLTGTYFFNDIDMSATFVVTVSNQVPGLAQIVAFDFAGQPWFRLKPQLQW